MQILGNSLKAITVLLSLLISPGVVWGLALAGAEDESLPTGVIVLSAGTRLVIPQVIIQRYQAEADQWGKPTYYLAYYYSLSRPSLQEEGKGAFYLPLSRADGDNAGENCILLVDIMALQYVDAEKGIFTTREDTDSVPHMLEYE